MDSEMEQNSEVEEIVPQEQTEAEQTEQVQEAPPVKPSGPSREQFKRLEQSKRQVEEKLRLQEEMLARFMQAQPVPQAPQEVDEFDTIDDSEFIPKGKVDARIEKRATAIAEKIVEKKLQESIQRQHEANFLVRLKGQFSDFSDVVNPQTLEALDEINPELAKTIADSKDPYKIGLQSYNFIKAMGLHKTQESAKSKDAEKKIAANAKTMQSPQAFSKRPMAQAFSSTDADRKALFEEMNSSARQAGYRY